MPESVNILYLRTGNSCRSQINEGWKRQVGGDLLTSLAKGVDL
jgi:protein-tyrosine-phosphatase